MRNPFNPHCSLVTAGHHDEALAVAERGRTRAFADLLVERQTGHQDSDPYTPVTVEQILDTINNQRALVLYFSMAAGYLYSWLLAPGAGTHWLTAYCSNYKSFSSSADIVLQFCGLKKVPRVSGVNINGSLKYLKISEILGREKNKWSCLLYLV